MDINLQIVGIFYNSTVTVTTASPTVKTLLDAAISTPSTPNDRNEASRFSYTINATPGGANFASSFLAVYDAPVKSRVLGNGTTYPAGEYFLDEQLSARPAYTVWQYYLFDAEGRYLNEYGKATPFDQQALTGVPLAIGSGHADVARVTWRLVTILGQPTTPASTNDPAYVAKGSAPSMRMSS